MSTEEQRKAEKPEDRTCRTCTRCMAVQPNADGYWHAAWVCLKNGAKCVGPDDCCSDFQLREAEKPKPSEAALRAAEQICLLVNHWITNPGPNPSRDHFAAIIDEELNRENDK